MEITFLQLTKEELISIINEAVRDAMPIVSYETNYKKPFIKGIHELAEFLDVSAPKAQKMKNEGFFPCFQDGRTVLFDPIKVKIAMEEYQQNRRRKKVKA